MLAYAGRYRRPGQGAPESEHLRRQRSDLGVGSTTPRATTGAVGPDDQPSGDRTAKSRTPLNNSRSSVPCSTEAPGVGRQDLGEWFEPWIACAMVEAGTDLPPSRKPIPLPALAGGPLPARVVRSPTLLRSRRRARSPIDRTAGPDEPGVHPIGRQPDRIWMNRVLHCRATTTVVITQLPAPLALWYAKPSRSYMVRVAL